MSAALYAKLVLQKSVTAAAALYAITSSCGARLVPRHGSGVGDVELGRGERFGVPSGAVCYICLYSPRILAISAAK